MKTALIACLLALMWLSKAPLLYAIDVVTSFTTTLSRLQISKDGGATWITIFDGNNVTVDLVSLSGQTIGTFLGEANIPAGTYNRARVTLTTATLTYTIDGTGITGGLTDLSPANTAVLGPIDLTVLAGAPPFPLTRTYNISVSCKHGAVTEATIDFDAQTTSVVTYTDSNGAGAGGVRALAGLTFEPRVTVAN